MLPFGYESGSAARSRGQAETTFFGPAMVPQAVQLYGVHGTGASDSGSECQAFQDGYHQNRSLSSLCR